MSREQRLEAALRKTVGYVEEMTEDEPGRTAPYWLDDVRAVLAGGSDE